jgi:hypothetical protein
MAVSEFAERLDRAQDAPNKMILWDPIQQRWRHEERWSRPQGMKLRCIPKFN